MSRRTLDIMNIVRRMFFTDHSQNVLKFQQQQGVGGVNLTASATRCDAFTQPNFFGKSAPDHFLQSGAMVAYLAHNQGVVGSIPTSAPNLIASVAQLAERLFCKQVVTGSSPV